MTSPASTSPEQSPEQRLAVSAGFAAAIALIAHQVGGKAVRDTLFLSEYAVTDLPLMLIVASVASVGTVLLTSKAMATLTPARLVPWAFLTSAALQVGWWGISFVAPAISAVAIYLHMTMFGAVLISGFWSMVNERFDPRTAKRVISRIAAGGTLGGLLGGLMVERLGAYMAAEHVLLILAGLHLFCGWRVGALAPEQANPSAESTVDMPEVHPKTEDTSPFSGLAVLLKGSFLRNIGLMVMLGTLSAACLDYVFKVEATEAFQGDEAGLMRVFAWFYTITGVLTFAVQTTLSNKALEKLGIARTVAAMPTAVSGGALLALFFPGLWVAAIARGAEAVLRSSVFRSAYELLYTPIPPREKRQAKTLIDVGFDRLGDALGGALVSLTLWLTVSNDTAEDVLLICAAAFGLVGIMLAFRLHQGYVKALEASLLSRAVELDLAEVQDATTRSTVMLTLASQGIDRADLEAALRSAAEGAQVTVSQLIASPELTARRQEAAQARQDRIPSEPTGPVTLEPVVQLTLELRSGDLTRVKQALRHPRAVDRALVPHLIPLLAWDEVYPLAIKLLRRLAPQNTGQLTDALHDVDEAFAVRRRIPRALTEGHPERALSALLEGLTDRRFEVRYQCGVALNRLTEKHPDLEVSADRIYPVIRKETRVGRRVWASQRLLDQGESNSGEIPFFDDFLKDRVDRSLQHVFTLLALILPKQPLTIAFRGLHTDDPTLRGTALEYLESVLPPDIRAPLWPFIEGEQGPAPANRNREQVLDELVRSNESIQLNLAALRARLGQSDGGGTQED
ncbi:MAG: hypothetical protein ACE366_05505 [Bradymonadia bacterium]